MGVALAMHPSLVPMARPLSRELPDAQCSDASGRNRCPSASADIGNDSSKVTSGRNRCPSVPSETNEPLFKSAIESSLTLASSSSLSSASSSSFPSHSRGRRRIASSS